ncbi:probable LRR receptor-like serine/threonine-protein kinase At3g47570 [Triticum dicoccoides]|uniref:probable LRR receptor-like serine/threonine-protein kinase At3g47570 n=1 Tax=Triticum dicoccoides TaxID=85692 RepID=UPI00188FC7C4|nr:probable LRR receptor-like serine/threonine-protein kinase At3g47570 [Triticum dicoccoides]
MAARMVYSVTRPRMAARMVSLATAARSAQMEVASRADAAFDLRPRRQFEPVGTDPEHAGQVLVIAKLEVNHIHFESSRSTGAAEQAAQPMQLSFFSLVLCSAETPRDRPTMPDVYAEVSAIKREYAVLRINNRTLLFLFAGISGDLSRNNMSGEIPNFFQSFNSLKHLNLSFNDLEGQMPQGGIFQNSSEMSVQGNIFILLKRRSKRSKQSDHPSYTEMKSFSYADLAKATNGFSPDNLVGSGAYGSVYKGVLESETNGMIAVKVFKLDQLGAPKSFVAECEAFRNTRHHNLVRVISACSTWDNKGNDFKALIIEYMANGTLESWIYSETRRPLSLGSRVTIAVDIAAALDYLHNSCVPPIVHCDLKPSNVLLDDAMGARLSDFGLAKFLQSHNSSSTITSTSLAGPRGSIGYIAPEYGIGNKISTAGDVYSYGIIILEMLTGKRPTDVLFNNGLSLQKFVGNAFPEKIREILDPNFNIPSLGDEGVDHGNHAMVGMLSCIMQLVQLGLSCSTETPKDRPTMPEVYAEVSAIKREYSALRVKE